MSWLRRVSWRYDVTVRELLRGAGSQRPVQSTPRAVTRLRNNHTLLQQLGLDDDDIQQLCASTPLELATRSYTRTLHRTRPAAGAVVAVLPSLSGRARPLLGRGLAEPADAGLPAPRRPACRHLSQLPAAAPGQPGVDVAAHLLAVTMFDDVRVTVGGVGQAWERPAGWWSAGRWSSR